MQFEGDTLYKELPSPRSPWALFIILVILIIFGGFWFIESERVEPSIQATAIPTTYLDTLTASVEQISIPSYSDSF